MGMGCCCIARRGPLMGVRETCHETRCGRGRLPRSWLAEALHSAPSCAICARPSRPHWRILKLAPSPAAVWERHCLSPGSQPGNALSRVGDAPKKLDSIALNHGHGPLAEPWPQPSRSRIHQGARTCRGRSRSLNSTALPSLTALVPRANPPIQSIRFLRLLSAGERPIHERKYPLPRQRQPLRPR